MSGEPKLALVTGGSRGIGRAVAMALADRGACSIVICGRTQESLDQTVADIRATGVEAEGIRADVSRPQDIEKVVNAIKQRQGYLDILVNNAVTSTSARFDELSDSEFQYHVDVKLMAYIRFCRLLLPLMVERSEPRIVNIGGMTARIVAPLRMTNGVVNAGVSNFTKQFANYAAAYGVTVNCVHPGYTATERVMQIFEREASETNSTVDAVIEQRTRGIPVGRLVRPEDIANAVLFFCAHESAMVTGQCLAVDGGSGEAVVY